ncbi:Olee1-like protein [Senna tora]|uniref:Olee1-like protein n=1 Tax=Senna tora TaxID=362788 RepID=A0A834X8R8_9FABA|nr:Olee1-like protein [Senna tora]
MRKRLLLDETKSIGNSNLGFNNAIVICDAKLGCLLLMLCFVPFCTIFPTALHWLNLTIFFCMVSIHLERIRGYDSKKIDEYLTDCICFLQNCTNFDISGGGTCRIWLSCYCGPQVEGLTRQPQNGQTVLINTWGDPIIRHGHLNIMFKEVTDQQCYFVHFAPICQVSKNYQARFVGSTISSFSSQVTADELEAFCFSNESIEILSSVAWHYPDGKRIQCSQHQPLNQKN